MKSHRSPAILLALGASVFAPLASAIEPIPETPGWRGFVVLGAGYTDLKSNLVAGNSVIDLGQPVVSSVNQGPQSDDTFHPVITGEVNYTFGNRWQAFFGTSLEDAVTLDGITQLGVRKGLGEAGILQGSFVFSGMPTRVWEDPYAEGVRPRRDGSRLHRPAPAMGPGPGLCVRAHVHLSRRVHRHRAQRPGSRQRCL